MKTVYTLSAMPYAQAKVFCHCADTISLVSYSTTVAEIKNGWLVVYGLYSRTTRRHIGAFVKEYANISYATAKTICEQRLAYNIHTGEVVSAL